MFETQELLIQLTTSDSPQIRNIISEILGRLLAEYPEEIQEVIIEGLNSPDPVTKATRARSVKYAGQKLTHQMTVDMLASDLITLAASDDIEVKKNGLEALQSIVHCNWFQMKIVLREKVPSILDFALQETKTRPELIQEVDLGPFKHTVDNGLPMRKAAYQLLETLIEKAADSIDLSRVVNTIIQDGLQDKAEECVVLNLGILAKMSVNSAGVVISYLD